jgi:SnoaL-like domain
MNGSQSISNFSRGGTAMPSIEDNKGIARRWLELITEYMIEEICEMTAPTWRMHRGTPGLPPGPEGVHEVFRIIGPIDQQWTVEDVIAEGDKVVLRATKSCVQESLLGIPDRGRRQTFTATFIHRIADGKIMETQ